MKLFQIEEPDGSPGDAAQGRGAAVGIEIAGGGIGRVAIAVGGNGEILPGADGDARCPGRRCRRSGRYRGGGGRGGSHDFARDRAPRGRGSLQGGAGRGCARAWRRGCRGGRYARSSRDRTHLMPKMVFVEQNGARREVEAPLGLSVLEIAHRNGIDLEGACEGSLACSTCHVIVDPEWYDLLKDPTEDEEDMLDLAFGLTRTSRLGCQIIITEELDGLTVSLPAGSRNMMTG